MECPRVQDLVLFFFYIDINDIVSSSDLLHFILFADDTSVFMSHNNLHTQADSFNSEINKLSEWLINNKLVLNVAKNPIYCIH